jgi:uncharacterized membrane protein
VLRRFSDVLLTIIPLLLAGVVTLEVCVLIGLKLNFANIIALPLLLGVGVAFKIYYITAWRAGQTNLLQSSLTRAVIFSAMTSATAFGSLWLSGHPGMSSMGELLALSLVCTLAAVLFQPVLMGRPARSGRMNDIASGGSHAAVLNYLGLAFGVVRTAGRCCEAVVVERTWHAMLDRVLHRGAGQSRPGWSRPNSAKPRKPRTVRV